MPRKLKTFVTVSGFFELAVAAPSMKAALEIWGSHSNAFQTGFARETDDPAIVAATSKEPGVVLRRAVGSKVTFKQNAELPTLAALKAGITQNGPAPADRQTATSKRRNAAKTAKVDPAVSRKAAQLYDLAEKRRQREADREAAQRLRQRERLERATQNAQAALNDAKERHVERVALIEKERDALERRAMIETERWSEEKKRLEAVLRRAGSD